MGVGVGSASETVSWVAVGGGFVGVFAGGTAVGVRVAGGSGVLVGWGVLVGGTGVLVGTGVRVGGTGVLVGTGVFVGGTAVGGFLVLVAVGCGGWVGANVGLGRGVLVGATVGTAVGGGAGGGGTMLAMSLTVFLTTSDTAQTLKKFALTMLGEF